MRCKMKKLCCCQSCNYEFEVIINNMEEYNNMIFGTKVHEVLELIDFINPNYDLIEDNFIIIMYYIILPPFLDCCLSRCKSCQWYTEW